MVLYRSSTLCVIEGWSIVEVIKVNVAKIKSSVGGDMGGVRRESIPEGGAEDLLKYKKWSIKDQTLTNDVALLGNQCGSLCCLCDLCLSTSQRTSLHPHSTTSLRLAWWPALMLPFAPHLCLRQNSSQLGKTP